MDISILKQELLDKKIRPFYVFIGDELALEDIYIDKICEISGLEKVRIESLKPIYSRLNTKGLFKIKPKVNIIRNDEEYLKTESIWSKLIDAQDLKGNIIIMLYTGIDKAKEFIKTHEPVLTRFDHIGSSLLKNRLQATTGMPLPYCEDIVKMCGNDYGRIKNELYKLGEFGRLNGYSWNTAYLEAKKCNLIHEEIGDIIFEFTGAIETRNIKKAYQLYPKILQTEDGNAIKLITVLYNSFRQILMIQSTPNNERTESVLGISQNMIYVISQKCNRYNVFELVDIVKTLRYLEKGIKIGTIEEKFAIPYLMGVIW